MWTQSSACYRRPFRKYAFGLAGVRSTPPPLVPSSPSSRCTCTPLLHAAWFESESCYDMHIDQIAPCVLCIPDDCTTEIRFFCLRRPRFPFFRDDRACSLISATFCIRAMRSFEMSVSLPRGVYRKLRERNSAELKSSCINYFFIIDTRQREREIFFRIFYF